MERLTEMHEGHRDRLRIRIAEEGMDALRPHEVLEYLLYQTIPRQDVNPLAHALLDHFGSVSAVLQAELPELCRVEGIGRNTAKWIALLGEAASGIASIEDTEPPVQITCMLDLIRNIDRLIQEFPAPCSVQICTNMIGEVIYRQIITPSRSWGEPAVLRHAMDNVLSSGAKGVILLQFVGKLLPEPDDYDREHIEKYAYTLHSAGCCLMDMLLISYGGITSMRQQGMIPDYRLGESAHFLREDYMRDLKDACALKLFTDNSFPPQDTKENEYVF